MTHILQKFYSPRVLGENVQHFLLWSFLGVEIGLLLVATLAGIEYALLIMLGLGLLFICFTGKILAVLALIVISPVVDIEGVPLLAIRVGKWIVVTIIILGWILAKALKGDRIYIPKTSANYFIIGFTAWGGLISLCAVDPLKSLVGLLKILSLFGLFYFMSDALRRRNDIMKAMHVWIGVGIALSLLGIFQYYQSMMRYGIEQRVSATFENPNNLGVFLFMLLPVVISLFFLRRGFKERVGLGLVLLLFCTVLFWTGSRASWLAIYVALFMFGIITKRKWLTISLLVAGVLLSLGITYSLFRGELHTLLRMGRGLAFRPILWGIAWQVFLDHPVFGVGFGCIADVFQSYYPIGALSLYKILSPAAGNPHCFILQIMAEMGLFGIILLVWFFKTYYCEFRKWLQRTQDEYFRAILTAFMATVPALFVHSFFERSAIIGAGSHTVFFWLSVAIFQAVRKIEHDSVHTPKRA